PRGTYAHSHREHAMSQEDRGGDRIEGTVTGDVSGQVAIGKNIRQQSTDGQALTPDERAELNRMLAVLRARVAAEAPDAERAAAGYGWTRAQPVRAVGAEPNVGGAARTGRRRGARGGTRGGAGKGGRGGGGVGRGRSRPRHARVRAPVVPEEAARPRLRRRVG